MLQQLVGRLERARSLDVISDRLQKTIASGVRPQAVKDVLRGTWLGHPLHPVLVHAPLGAFLSAAVLDAIPGQGRAATTLIKVGAASSPATVAAGWADWSLLTPEQRRVGLVHAAANAVAVSLYIASLYARAHGSSARGRLLAYAGLSVMGAGAYLGGHLTYSQGAGVERSELELENIWS